MANASRQIILRDKEEAIRLLGKNREHIKLVQELYPVTIVDRGENVLVSGSDSEVEAVHRIFGEVLEAVRRGNRVDAESFKYALASAGDGSRPSLSDIMGETIKVSNGCGPVRPKSGRRGWVASRRRRRPALAAGCRRTGGTPSPAAARSGDESRAGAIRSSAR